MQGNIFANHNFFVNVCHVNYSRYMSRIWGDLFSAITQHDIVVYDTHTCISNQVQGDLQFQPWQIQITINTLNKLCHTVNNKISLHLLTCSCMTAIQYM